MVKVTNTSRHDHVLYDREKHPVTIRAGQSEDVDLEDVVARRLRDRHTYLEVGGGSKSKSQKKNAEADQGSEEEESQYSATELADAAENEKVTYQELLSESLKILGSDNMPDPRTKENLIEALRAHEE